MKGTVKPGQNPTVRRYRPSRYHIEPSASSSRREAEEAAEQRHARTDFSTLSLVVRRPIQSLPAASPRPRTGTIDGSD